MTSSFSISQTSGIMESGPQTMESTFSPDPSSLPQVAKEKSKRPQLSCNACRARKVKCDRVQPCTACSLHQIAELCHYDLTETERHPILQAEALREKDREITRLRHEVQLLGGLAVQSGFPGPHERRVKRKGDQGLKGRKTLTLRQKRRWKGEDLDGAAAHSLAVDRTDELAPALCHSGAGFSPIISWNLDQLAPTATTNHPFPTLWTAKEGTSCLIRMLPIEGDILTCLESFERRAVAIAFPHVPQALMRAEIRVFLANIEHPALPRPDFLAVLFAALALGIQHGLHDCCGGHWNPRIIESEAQRTDVFVAAAMQALRLASFTNRPTTAALEALIMIGSYLTDSGRIADSWALFGQTVRMAQALGLHREDTSWSKRSSQPSSQYPMRKALWSWIVQVDQQFAISLDRPLAICSPSAGAIALEQTFPFDYDWSYVELLNRLGRQILSAGRSNDVQADELANRLQNARANLPVHQRFDRSWLERGILANWTRDVQAAMLHCRSHSLSILVLRDQVPSSASLEDRYSASKGIAESTNLHSAGRFRESCREVLFAFEFIHACAPAALVSWTLCFQAFAAATGLVRSLPVLGQCLDTAMVQQTHDTLFEMRDRGIHSSAGIMADQLRASIDVHQGQSSNLAKIPEDYSGVVVGHHGIHHHPFDPPIFSDMPTSSIFPFPSPYHTTPLPRRIILSQPPAKKAKSKALPNPSITKSKPPSRKPVTKLKVRKPSTPFRHSDTLWLRDAWPSGPVFSSPPITNISTSITKPNLYSPAAPPPLDFSGIPPYASRAHGSPNLADLPHFATSSIATSLSSTQSSPIDPHSPHHGSSISLPGASSHAYALALPAGHAALDYSRGMILPPQQNLSTTTSSPPSERAAATVVATATAAATTAAFTKSAPHSSTRCWDADGVADELAQEAVVPEYFLGTGGFDAVAQLGAMELDAEVGGLGDGGRLWWQGLGGFEAFG